MLFLHILNHNIMLTFSVDQDAVVLYLLQLLIGTGQCGKRKKGEPAKTVSKYKPIEIRESSIYRVDVNSTLYNLRFYMRRIYI